MKELKCPRCRSSSLATVEEILGHAGCKVDANTGAIDFDGDTEVFWDTSESKRGGRNRGILIHCRACGHEWFPKVLWPKMPGELAAAS